MLVDRDSSNRSSSIIINSGSRTKRRTLMCGDERKQGQQKSTGAETENGNTLMMEKKRDIGRIEHDR